MLKKPHADDHFCPVMATLNLLNQRWNLHIVKSLLSGKKRFNELSREHGINPRTLRERLIALELEGVICRNVISTMPPNVEYCLSKKGEALNDIFEALGEWGVRWMDAPPCCAEKPAESICDEADAVPS